MLHTSTLTTVTHPTSTAAADDNNDDVDDIDDDNNIYHLHQSYRYAAGSMRCIAMVIRTCGKCRTGPT